MRSNGKFLRGEPQAPDAAPARGRFSPMSRAVPVVVAVIAAENFVIELRPVGITHGWSRILVAERKGMTGPCGCRRPACPRRYARDRRHGRLRRGVAADADEKQIGVFQRFDVRKVIAVIRRENRERALHPARLQFGFRKRWDVVLCRIPGSPMRKKTCGGLGSASAARAGRSQATRRSRTAIRSEVLMGRMTGGRKLCQGSPAWGIFLDAEANVDRRDGAALVL